MQAITNIECGNQTTVTDVILLGFGDLPELQIFLFLMFLVSYIVTMAGNILIVVLIVTYQHLHTPMYFFLGNLSCLETCYSSTILPRTLASLLTGDRTISVCSCFVQFNLFSGLVPTECYLLASMSCDQYFAICKPLHCAMIMNGRFCTNLATVSWIGGFLASSVTTYLISELTFCGPNEMDHFFCDLTPMIKLSCSDTYLIELVTLIFSSLFTAPFSVNPDILYLYHYNHPENLFHHWESKGLFHLLLSPHGGDNFLWDPHHCVYATKQNERSKQNILSSTQS
ncbi:unnamed protein product [Lepidochelys olivacea]